jgi:hypothetical protein
MKDSGVIVKRGAVTKRPPRPAASRLGDMPLPPAKDGRSPLLRRIHTYRRAGVLVGLLEFLRRRSDCSTCDRRRILPTHPGLYGCSLCSACSGGPERMLITQSKCAKGAWQSRKLP